MLSVDEINKLQAENEQLRKVNILNDLLTVLRAHCWERLRVNY